MKSFLLYAALIVALNAINASWLVFAVVLGAATLAIVSIDEGWWK